MSRMDIVTAREYESNGETRTAFTRIGTAWPNRNGPGFRLVFDALPVASMNRDGRVEVTAMLMEPRDNNSGGGQRSQRQSGGFDD